MFDAFLQGLMLVFQWPAIGFVVLGTLLGIWLSAVPGLGGIIGIVILLPFTFSMDPVSAFALLLGLYAVTGQGDTITAIMMGVPGTVAGQATILDGYPLAKQGQASRAFGAAFFVSAAGGVIGSLLLAASLPLVQPVVLLFGAPEVFRLGVLGVVMVGSLSGKSLLNGLAAAMLGILFSTVGYAETVAVPRYWFGTTYLLENFPLVPAVLGFFAIPQLLELASRGETIARVTPGKDHNAQLWQGVTDVLKNWWLSLRCIAIGVYIGILPGLGPAMSDWMAYGHAVQSAKDKSKFGKGDIRGVIAPECATAATRPGDLIPTVAFGVPGSFACAILLGALLIQGLRPGPDMLGPKLPITFSMVWTMIVANILAAGILMMWTRQVAKVAFIDGHLIVPAVIAFVLMGSFLDGASYGDWITCIGMGLLGYWFQRAGWARPPFVLAFVLGPILETNFHISNRAYDGLNWLGKPIVLVLIAIVVFTLIMIARGVIKSRRAGDAPVETGEGTDDNPLFSLPLGALLLVVFVIAGVMALKWPLEVKEFPLVACVPGAMFAAWCVWRDRAEARAAIQRAGSLVAAVRASAEQAMLSRAAALVGYLVVVLIVSYLAGQIAALALFMAVYLWRWGHYNWKICLGYTAVGVAFIWGFYDRLLHVHWLDTLLFG